MLPIFTINIQNIREMFRKNCFSGLITVGPMLFLENRKLTLYN